ncbi:MAG TPA: hypothetical protein VKC53_03795 [Patescibacteria group bacterium]|nr:hypothetical protein [Patescibacteria group bacterium]
MKEQDDKWKMTPELAARIVEIREEMRQHRLDLLEEAKKWGNELDGELVGVCGHMTGGMGFRQYPVYKQEDDKHFISHGPKDQLYLFEGTLDDYIKVQEEVKRKCEEAGKERLLIMKPNENYEERNGRMIQFVNPNYIFGRKMQSIKSWMKEYT